MCIGILTERWYLPLLDDSKHLISTPCTAIITQHRAFGYQTGAALGILRCKNDGLLARGEGEQL